MSAKYVVEVEVTTYSQMVIEVEEGETPEQVVRDYVDDGLFVRGIHSADLASIVSLEEKIDD